MSLYFKKLLINFFGTTLQILGILWTLVEATAFFFSEETWASNIKSFWWIFLLVGMGIGMFRGRPKLSLIDRIPELDVDIEVRVGNVFSTNGTVIIGSNTTFDTTLEDDTISEKSLQGQFTKKYCRSISDLDNQITSSLNSISPNNIRTATGNDKPYGKLEEYKFGTVATIEGNGKKAYFVAIAKLNQYRVAKANREEFLDSLPRIWSQIRNRGGFESLSCPILGSGFSRLNMSREELIREIIKSFVVATVESKFCEKLTISISFNDFLKGRVDLHRLERFIEHECIYIAPIANQNGSVIGIPVG